MSNTGRAHPGSSAPPASPESDPDHFGTGRRRDGSHPATLNGDRTTANRRWSGETWRAGTGEEAAIARWRGGTLPSLDPAPT